MKNNIIFIGYMGCGKSTIGRHLAKMLSISFADTDQWIEEKEGMAISEIFASKGEEYFRNMETECLKHFMLKEGLKQKEELQDANNTNMKVERIISVGGGLPVREENQKLLQQMGEVIYLKASVRTIYERLKGDTTRPLLQGADPMKKIKEMLDVREHIYRAAAHRVIEVDGKNVNEIIKEIIKDYDDIS